MRKKRRNYSAEIVKIGNKSYVHRKDKKEYNYYVPLETILFLSKNEEKK